MADPPENPPPKPPSEKHGSPPATFPAPPRRSDEATIPRHRHRRVLSVLTVVASVLALVQVNYLTDRKWVHTIAANVCGGFAGWALVMLWRDQPALFVGAQGREEKRVMGLNGGVDGQSPGKTGGEDVRGHGGYCRYCHRASQTDGV